MKFMLYVTCNSQVLLNALEAVIASLQHAGTQLSTSQFTLLVLGTNHGKES